MCGNRRSMSEIPMDRAHSLHQPEAESFVVLQRTMDPKHLLQELSMRASKYSINLDQQVFRDDSIPPSHGSSALVYQGILRPQEIKVAIKTFRSCSPGDLEKLKLAFRELHLWSKLRHENIVPLLGITTKFDDTVSIVSEWMVNGNAHDYVQSRANDPRPLLLGIAHGLHYLHSQPNPVLHGDLKGYNVLISADGRALLSDFGLSHSATSSFSMSISKPLGGSVPWMSPEHIDEFEISVATDIWSFGMTALELFTGQAPYHTCRTLTNIVIQILRGPPDRPNYESTCSRLTDDWWKLCLLCWHRDPALRPSTADVIKRIQYYIGLSKPFLNTSQNQVGSSAVHVSNSPTSSIEFSHGPYLTCPLLQCRYPNHESGGWCLKMVSCANIAEHFIEHEITDLPCETELLCEWDYCGEYIIRHHFMRHLREHHLGHGEGPRGREHERA